MFDWGGADRLILLADSIARTEETATLCSIQARFEVQPARASVPGIPIELFFLPISIALETAVQSRALRLK
jgi:hypothetical protein